MSSHEIGNYSSATASNMGALYNLFDYIKLHLLDEPHGFEYVTRNASTHCPLGHTVNNFSIAKNDPETQSEIIVSIDSKEVETSKSHIVLFTICIKNLEKSFSFHIRVQTSTLSSGDKTVVFAVTTSTLTYTNGKNDKLVCCRTFEEFYESMLNCGNDTKVMFQFETGENIMNAVRQKVDFDRYTEQFPIQDPAIDLIFFHFKFGFKNRSTSSI